MVSNKKNTKNTIVAFISGVGLTYIALTQVKVVKDIIFKK